MSKPASTFPRLEGAEAQAQFLTSPEAVLDSIGLRVPAALAEVVRRSSQVPPPPSASAPVKAPRRRKGGAK